MIKIKAKIRTKMTQEKSQREGYREIEKKKTLICHQIIMPIITCCKYIVISSSFFNI